MSGRKIVQIAAVPAAGGGPMCVLALCNDGAVFATSVDGLGWNLLPPIPQPEPAAPNTPISLPEIVVDEERGGYKAVFTLSRREA